MPDIRKLRQSMTATAAPPVMPLETIIVARRIGQTTDAAVPQTAKVITGQRQKMSRIGRFLEAFRAYTANEEPSF